tara:strand:- start:30 stop:518 length:489 start_codon:yes stop_codon:yes gene_type:complete
MQTRFKILIASIGGAIALGGLSGAAVAGKMHEGGGGRMGVMLSMVDTNGDGKITRAEADGFRDAQFAKFDADKNGSLNADEYRALMEDFRRQMMMARFAKHDTNGDGAISKDEMGGRISQMFERMDRNDDGVIEGDEMGRGHHGRHGDDDDDDHRGRDKKDK